MKRLALLFGLVMVWAGQIVNAQIQLSNLSLSGSATATTTSSAYRYTKHTRSSGGRGGGHTTTYYSWDTYLAQTTSQSLALILNSSSGTATATGTYYAPTYNATASGTASLSYSANTAVFTTAYKASTTINTPQVAHQRVTATTQANSTFYFTLTDYTNVTVTATGSANGAFALYGKLDEGVGVILALNGPGTVTTSASLPPGDYWIPSSTGGSAAQDTQFNTLLNIGTTNADYSFTVTFSKGSEGG